MYDVYQIRVGDTLGSLASRYNTTPEVLRNLNQNSSFGVGSTIVVPRTFEYFDMYNIQKGDSLYEIARRYNTDYNLLALLNGLNVTDYIYPNTSILVPKRDIKYYITKDGDTISSVNNLLSSDINNLINQNNNIYLKEGQLIVYKD
ncbi:MAG: LysM peptidoglycan-binding domain-containing protein [Bacilli bacterium]|nr:LysM peptidoglycan-binding domain-containing protein [Bacilli bacterium]